MNIKMEDEHERVTKARNMHTCPKCGIAKTFGEGAPVTCWGECWRGVEGLKSSPLSMQDWLKPFIQN